MNDEQIEHMVYRFLGWKLPNDFNPDGGVVFNKPSYPNLMPQGTNLLSFRQTEAMIRYLVEDLPNYKPTDKLVMAGKALEIALPYIRDAKDVPKAKLRDDLITVLQALKLTDIEQEQPE